MENQKDWNALIAEGLRVVAKRKSISFDRAELCTALQYEISLTKGKALDLVGMMIHKGYINSERVGVRTIIGVTEKGEQEIQKGLPPKTADGPDVLQDPAA